MITTFRARIRAWHLWLIVGTVVAVAEEIAPTGQLLSEGVDRAIERHPILVRAAIIITALHLVNWLPARVDPLAHIPGARKRLDITVHRLVRTLPR
ncbi:MULTISPECIES: DUF7427 family protein [Nocardia]|uniref:DUF7427 family protein n=1 Tax=Nocardia TaxID=1817 RepID=UPI000D696CC3|nr:MULTISPECIES: hypothetical protein [Nocardia]